MNFVNRSLEGGRTRGGVGALRRVRASSLLASDLAPASLSCSMGSTEELTQELRRMVRDSGAIAKEEEKNQRRDSSKRAG